jgi:hypothetical protein
MGEVAPQRLIRWPLILVFCVTVFLVWPALGYTYALASFKIEGDATREIVPGIQVPIELRFTNGQPKPMTISRLRVSIEQLDTPHADSGHPCTLEDFELTQVSGYEEWILLPNSTIGLRELGLAPSKWPQITMRNRPVNQDGCKGAKLTLNYSAHGVLGT